MQIYFDHSGGQKTQMGLTGLKSKYRQNCTPSGGLRGESVSLPFPVPRSRLRSLACGFFFHLQSCNSKSGPSRTVVVITSSLTPLPPSYKDPVITWGPSKESRIMSASQGP